MGLVAYRRDGDVAMQVTRSQVFPDAVYGFNIYALARLRPNGGFAQNG